MSTSPLQSVVLVVAQQPSVVLVADPQVMVVDGPSPVQVVQVEGQTISRAVVVNAPVVTVVHVAEQGPQGASGGGMAASYQQAVAAQVWTVAHNLGRFPHVRVVDNLRKTLVADVEDVDANVVQIIHSAALTGYVYFS